MSDIMRQRLAFIRPLEIGAVAAGGWTLRDASSPAPGEIRYGFDRAGGRVEVVVVRKDPARRGYATTSHHVVSYRWGARRPPAAVEALVGAVVLLVRANERRMDIDATWLEVDAVGEAQSAPGPPAALSSPPSRLTEPTALLSRAALYLVPGHLGDSGDLGSRALRILASVRHIVVEGGMSQTAVELLRLRGIDPSDKVWIEAWDHGAEHPSIASVRGAYARDEPVCLFGVAEGSPAFVDPGSDIIADAERLGVPIRSVGGASSLGAALMRISVDLQEFMFLGRLETREHLERIARNAATAPGLPIVVFGYGRRECRPLLPELVRSVWSPGAHGWILSDLASDHERVIPMTDDWDDWIDAYESLRYDVRMILVLDRRDPGK